MENGKMESAANNKQTILWLALIVFMNFPIHEYNFVAANYYVE